METKMNSWNEFQMLWKALWVLGGDTDLLPRLELLMRLRDFNWPRLEKEWEQWYKSKSKEELDKLPPFKSCGPYPFGELYKIYKYHIKKSEK